MMKPELFDGEIRALYRTAETDGVFCYTFFKALGEKAIRCPSPVNAPPAICGSRKTSLLAPIAWKSASW